MHRILLLEQQQSLQTMIRDPQGEAAGHRCLGNVHLHLHGCPDPNHLQWRCRPKARPWLSVVANAPGTCQGPWQNTWAFKTLSLSEAVVYPSKDSTLPDCVKVKGRLHLRASFLFLFHFLVAKVTTRLCHKFNVVVSGLRRLNSIFGCKRTPRTDKVFG